VGLERASLAAESLPSEVASLDATGIIVWANEAWLHAARTESKELLAGCTIGVDFLKVSSSLGTPIAKVIATGVAAVIAGEHGRFEQELRSADGTRRWRLQASPLRGSSRGAVLIRTEITLPVRDVPPDLADPEDLQDRVSKLTPREHEVLGLMTRGLNNREIAAELGIAYTTVRSHAQAVIEKLDARSRLQAVARASRAVVGGGMRRVALGIGHQDVGVPAHIGLFYDAEPDLRLRQLEFLRPAIDDPSQGIVLFGPPGVARSMLANLEADLGRSLESDVRSGRLLVAQTDSDPDQLLENIRDALAALTARGTDGIRFIADVKWGAPGFPMPEDALWVESRVNEMLHGTKSLMVCAYDVSRLPDRALVYGGLDTHPHLVIGDQLKENPSYLAPAVYMRGLLAQLRSSA
jgi:DNA-binding CsgD family transcriptional regulator